MLCFYPDHAQSEVVRTLFARTRLLKSRSKFIWIILLSIHVSDCQVNLDLYHEEKEVGGGVANEFPVYKLTMQELPRKPVTFFTVINDREKV